MAFSKSFPKTKDKYPVWEEVYLTDEEEKLVEQQAREENKKLMRECIQDAKAVSEPGIDITPIAIALFEKRASHQVYWKESKCKAKFDKSSQSSLSTY